MELITSIGNYIDYTAPKEAASTLATRKLRDYADLARESGYEGLEALRRDPGKTSRQVLSEGHKDLVDITLGIWAT